MPSQSVEEYLEAIYRIGGESGTVSTCGLAEQLGVAPPSVTTMLGRLSRDGFVEYTRYRGITLTPLGREMAASTIRRHRLSERLLTDVLGMPWDQVHEEACKLEHVITGEVEERAFHLLGKPKRCPHGHLLEGEEDQRLLRLSDTAPGCRVRVIKITDESRELLKEAAQTGVIPSAEILVVSFEDGKMSLQVNGNNRIVEIGLAENIWVCPLDRTD